MTYLFSSNLRLALLELAIYGLAATTGVLFPARMEAAVEWVGRAFRRIANRRVLAVFVTVATVLTLRGALLPWVGVPVPGVHDEFSYLLAADTFASGRVTNPPIPAWKSLETFYVIQQPTYASMYPPAQGLVLAAGRILAGNPWFGVYLSCGFMCGAVCWALQGWMSPSWAFLGGLLAAFRLGTFSYWMESYWGGSVAALAGAVAFGAAIRLVRSRRVQYALILAVAAIVLANSRPFEGLVLLLPLSLFVSWALFRHRSKYGAALLRSMAATVLTVLFAGGALMGYYFWRVTGSPFLMPYQVNERTYELTGPFLWQALRRPPQYRHAVMERYFVPREQAAYRLAHTLRGWTGESWRKLDSLAYFFFWPAILPVCVAIPFLFRRWRIRLILLFLAVSVIGLSLEIWPMAFHYAAPITVVMTFLLVESLSWWTQVRWRGRPVGLTLSAGIIAACGLLLLLRMTAAGLDIPVPDYGLVPWFTVAPGNLDRARLARRLESLPGKHLVIVHYRPNHDLYDEWVHNTADVEASRVVWARDSGSDANRHLIRCLPGRTVWLLDADARPPKLLRFTPSD